MKPFINIGVLGSNFLIDNKLNPQPNGKKIEAVLSILYNEKSIYIWYQIVQ